MNNYQKVKEKIQELCPELKKLSFGCKLIVKDSDGKKHKVIFASKADYAGLIWDNGNTGSYVEEWIVKILGHEPHLADVLRATRKYNPQFYFVRESKLLQSGTEEIVDKWNLEKDLLCSQSEETINRLADILL